MRYLISYFASIILSFVLITFWYLIFLPQNNFSFNSFLDLFENQSYLIGVASFSLIIFVVILIAILIIKKETNGKNIKHNPS